MGSFFFRPPAPRRQLVRALPSSGEAWGTITRYLPRRFELCALYPGSRASGGRRVHRMDVRPPFDFPSRTRAKP